MYFETIVEFSIDVKSSTDALDVVTTGKVKTQRIAYLVEAESPTEAEVKITKHLIDNGENEFRVKSAKESRISKVIE